MVQNSFTPCHFLWSDLNILFKYWIENLEEYKICDNSQLPLLILFNNLHSFFNSLFL